MEEAKSATQALRGARLIDSRRKLPVWAKPNANSSSRISRITRMKRRGSKTDGEHHSEGGIKQKQEQERGGRGTVGCTKHRSVLGTMLPTSLDRVDQRFEALDADFEAVAGFDGADTARRAGENDVARKQGHVGRDKGDQVVAI